MRYPSLFIASIAALLVATGCGRVSSVQPALPAASTGSKAGVKPVGTKPAPGYKSARPSVSVTPGRPSAGGAVSQVGHGRVVGRVVATQDGQSYAPVAGASVVVEGTAIKATTDAMGRFTATVPAGTHMFSARQMGFKTVSPTSVMVEANGQATVPDILMVPGEGSNGITAMAFGQEVEYGREGEPPATLIAPKGVAVRGGDVLVLDVNNMPGVLTGIIRQYKGGSGEFAGKYGDYTKWLGRNIMRNTVRAIALDSQGRALVLDGPRQIWRFQPDGDKDRQISVDIENGNDIAVGPSGDVFIAHAAGLTRLNPEGEVPTPVGSLGDCQAVAAGKDGLWAVTGNKVARLTDGGQLVFEFGAGGTTADKAVEFGQAVDVAVDPKHGNVVVVDKGHKNVYVFNNEGALIGKVGEGVFFEPVACTIDNDGRIFVVDAGKQKVYQFVPTLTK